MNYVAKVAYDGSKFFGFQRLNEETSVQKLLEEALTKINKHTVEIKGAGRTDRGVHANGQFISFSLNVDIDIDGLKDGLNSLVAPYVYIKEIKEVDEQFHARFNALKKTYIYKINLGEYDPKLSDYVYQSKYNLDVNKLKDVAKKYLGVHNFHNFVSGERDNYDCIIYDISFSFKDNILNIIFEGKSFYRYMVRNLVGMMIEVARGKEDISKVEEMLNSKEEMYGYTAPACGLYLENVEY